MPKMMQDHGSQPVHRRIRPPTGKKRRPAATEKTADGRLVRLVQQDRLYQEVSIDLGPTDIDRVLREANVGRQQDQAKLAAEILEKDWDIAQAVQTRTAAVLGAAWEVQPQADTDRAREVADFVRQALASAGTGAAAPLDTFEQLLGAMLTAYLPGFSVNEIVWREGGREIAGFQFIPQHHFTFYESMDRPLLVTPENRSGYALPSHKFIVHRYRHRRGDITRGGLIRPLAWLYAFKNLNLKDLLRYIEKFGMPFIAARLDQHAFDHERHKIAWLIRNFGSDGGGVFTKGAELEFIEGNGSNAEVHFKFLDYCERAVSKLILGQTSTSDGRDSNRSTAAIHNLVRHDLCIDDCRALAQTIRQDVIRPLVQFNFGPDEPLPRFAMACDLPPDRETESRIVQNLANAGYSIAPADIEAKFGYRLSRANGETA